MSRLGLALLTLPLALTAALPSAALAQDVADRVAFGDDVVVGPNEVVNDAVSFGGDTYVYGEVRGDAVSFGGTVEVLDQGRVDGEATAFGGPVVNQAVAHGEGLGVDGGAGVSPGSDITHAHEPGFLSELARNASAHVMLFLLGLLMISLGRERLRKVQTTMVRDGLKTTGLGALAYVAAAVLLIVLVITIVGIPIAILLGMALPVLTYVGLAAAATVLGAALPIKQLEGNEIGQLAAGVGVLFVASLIPVAGTVGTALAACLGFGALVRTQLGKALPEDLPSPESVDGGAPVTI